MGKAHLYEALNLVNQGTDEAVRGLARLTRSTEFVVPMVLPGPVSIHARTQEGERS
jgi:hypothetical protein